MSKFNIGDKVKFKNPHDIIDFDEYDQESNEFWYKNINTIFTISSIVSSIENSDTYYYSLQYPNGENIMDVLCSYKELEPYNHIPTNPFPDNLFEI